MNYLFVCLFLLASRPILTADLERKTQEQEFLLGSAEAQKTQEVEALAGLDNAQEDSHLGEKSIPIKGPLNFILTGPDGTKTTTSETTYVLIAANSRYLNTLYQYSVSERASPPEIALDVDDYPAFTMMLEFLNNDRVAITELSQIAHLIHYAHKFEVNPLGQYIAKLFKEKHFVPMLNELKSLHPIMPLLEKLRAANSGGKGKEDQAWNMEILSELGHYIIYRGHLADKASKRLYQDFYSHFSKDSVMAHALAIKPSLVDEARKKASEEYLSKQIDIENKRVAKIAKALLIKINQEYGQKSINGKNTTIYVRVQASLAKRIALAIQAESEGEYEVMLEIDVPAYNRRSNYPKGGFCCRLCNRNVCGHGFEPSCAFGITTALSYMCLYPMQVLSLNCCCCFCTDCCAAHSECSDLCNLMWCNEWISRGVFYCIYEGLTCLCNGCKGTSRLLRVMRKVR